MNNFIFNMQTKIYFGKDQLHSLESEVQGKYNSILLVYGGGHIKKSGLYDELLKHLPTNKVYEVSGVTPNPTLDLIYKGISICKEKEIDLVIAVGGGSVIDSAKMISLGATLDEDVWDVVSRKVIVEPSHQAVPLITVVTSSGTASEMNNFAVISNSTTKEKKSFSHLSLKPIVSFSDPMVLFTLSDRQLSAGIVDTISHLLEQYFSSHEDEELVDRQIEAVLKTVFTLGTRVFVDRNNYDILANLMWSSMLALNNSMILGRKNGGDWLAHEIEHQFSALYDIVHAEGMAIVHPAVLDFFLEKDIIEGQALTKFVNLGKNVFGFETQEQGAVVAKKVIQNIRDFFIKMKMETMIDDVVTEKIDKETIAKRVAGETGFGTYHRLYYADVVDILNKI